MRRLMFVLSQLRDRLFENTIGIVRVSRCSAATIGVDCFGVDPCVQC